MAKHGSVTGEHAHKKKVCRMGKYAGVLPDSPLFLHDLLYRRKPHSARSLSTHSDSVDNSTPSSDSILAPLQSASILPPLPTVLSVCGFEQINHIDSEMQNDHSLQHLISCENPDLSKTDIHWKAVILFSARYLPHKQISNNAVQQIALHTGFATSASTVR